MCENPNVFLYISIVFQVISRFDKNENVVYHIVTLKKCCTLIYGNFNFVFFLLWHLLKPLKIII